MIDFSLFEDVSKRLAEFNIEHAFVQCSASCRDIDVVLSPSDLDRAVWCLCDLLSARGLPITKVVKKSFIWQIYFFDNTKGMELNLDLMPEFSFRGVPYLTWQEIRKEIVEESSPPVLSPDFVFYYKAVRSRLQSGVLTEHKFPNDGTCFSNFICSKVLSAESTKFLFIRFLVWSIQVRPLASFSGLSMNLISKFKARLNILRDISY